MLVGFRRGALGSMKFNVIHHCFSSKPPISSLRGSMRNCAPSKAISLRTIPQRGTRCIGSLIVMSTMGLVYFQFNKSFVFCSADAGGGGAPADLPSPSDILAKVLEKYQVELNEMGVSGLAGFCSGYCLKHVSQEVAFGVGAVFMLLQVMQHMGYININYKKVNDDITEKLDMDGDGKLTHNDFKVLIDNITRYLSEGLPSVSGFAAGFTLGMYYS